MLLRHLQFIFTVFSKIALMSCTVSINDPQDNCMVSLVIPKESIKTACTGGSNYHTDQKMKSVESQLLSIRRDMNSLNIRLTKDTLNQNLQRRDKSEISERLFKLENSVASLQTNLTKEREHGNGKEVNMETFNRKKMVRLIKSTLRKEMGVLKEEIKRDIHYEFRQQLKDDIRSELLSYIIQSNKLVNGINSEVLFNGVEHYGDRNYYDPSSHTEKHYRREFVNNKRPIQERYETMDSAVNNELPEKPQSRILQTESETKELDIKEAIVILSDEVKKHLDKQTKKVKEIVGQHLNQTESKLSKVSDNLDKKFDTKYENVFKDNKGYKDISDRIEQIEHDVETLSTGLSSLLQANTLSGEIREQFDLEKVALENRILSKLSADSNPIKLELENLRDQTQATSNLIQATAKSQKQTQYSLQNFNATFKLKNYYLEQSIRTMTEQINQINKTLYPDYEDSFSIGETLHELDMYDAIDFVAEIKDIWPAVLQNISSIVQVHQNDIDFVQEGFEHIRSKFSDVLKNHTDLSDRIDKFQSQVHKIQDRVSFHEQVKRQEALEKNEWAQVNFNHTFSRSGCYGGKKFVKKTGYEVGAYVGVVLCSEKRYKIYLSDSLSETFLNIGDTNQNGEDHCEFVGASKTSEVKLKKGPSLFERIPGYRRGNWGEVPIKAKLSFFSPTPEWYECGVTIP
ncbi:uncharacterized protein LOC123536343 [Mercenaria mercenaria]|uniref:uncharacterized protein LOC123536343 n=1 Tax=Mercenaria mercenaria TaxID=6596 RepID=UPI00234EA127|nr:uncharacterized protein LOC123536343 [Mercenaria mercenaria]XP_045175395.2 uncharacterized protein LOC123536343 [Mercenaria mercenaria]XP_053384460.1 uncharacterized protein LOC123536343 [Mercenaria mercenaria]